MKARLSIRERVVFPDGSLVEMVVWRVPRPVSPASHGFKYSLAYVVGGKRVVGYDNERGKGGHKHVKGREGIFEFMSIDDLVARFVAAVEAIRRRL
jgi:hypothetical protein